MVPGNHTWLPVALLKLATEKQMERPLQLYLYLKMFADGKCHRQDNVLTQLREDLGIRDNRTYAKHMNRLLREDWIGFNPKSGYYFIRSFKKLQYKLGLKGRRIAKVTLQDLQQWQPYYTAVLLTDNVERQKFYWEKKKHVPGAATRQKRIAKQPRGFFDPPGYYGRSNKRIGELVGCGQTRACQLKHKAVEAGYIKVRPHVEVLYTLNERDYFIRDQLLEQCPSLKGRLIFRTVEQKGVKKIQLIKQCYDEIIPKGITLSYRRS